MHLLGTSGHTRRWECLRSAFVGPGRNVLKELGFCPGSAGELQGLSVEDPERPRKIRNARSWEGH